jgi:hypothetical protein
VEREDKKRQRRPGITSLDINATTTITTTSQKTDQDYRLQGGTKTDKMAHVLQS